MKKINKVLAILLAGIMLFGMFSVSASAKEMTKAEVVKLYHTLLKKTAENHKVVMAKCDWKTRYTSDLSGLSGLDLKRTQKDFADNDGQWFGDTYENYYYGVIGEYEEAEDTGIYSAFNISSEIEWGGYEVKTATYKDSQIIIELEYDDYYYSYEKITVNLTKNNGIRSIKEEIYEEWENYSSIRFIPFKTTYESIDTYTFVYETVPAKSLTLSETSITLGYKETAEITYTVGPENASFKGVEVYDVYDENDNSVALVYEEDGKIIIEATDEGTGIVEVYTYSGDLVATCQVTVEYTVWERIRSIFDMIIFLLFGIEY